MFQVQKLIDVFEAYELSDFRTKVRIVPDRGALVSHFEVDGASILYLDRATYADPSKNVRGGIPVLFPVCGPLREGSFQVDGMTYSMKQHGLARQLPWRMVGADTGECAALELELVSTPQTLSQYPFEFQVLFRFEVRDGRLLLRQTYRNRSQLEMPVQFGFHPYFQVSDKTQLRFDIPATRYLDNKTNKQGDFSNRFDFAQEEIDWTFPGLTSSRASVADRARGIQLELEYDEHFPYLVFWSLRGKDFVCPEPWSAGRFAMNTGEGRSVIPPGGSLLADFSLRVSKL